MWQISLIQLMNKISKIYCILYVHYAMRKLYFPYFHKTLEYWILKPNTNYLSGGMQVNLTKICYFKKDMMCQEEFQIRKIKVNLYFLFLQGSCIRSLIRKIPPLFFIMQLIYGFRDGAVNNLGALFEEKVKKTRFLHQIPATLFDLSMGSLAKHWKLFVGNRCFGDEQRPDELNPLRHLRKFSLCF